MNQYNGLSEETLTQIFDYYSQKIKEENVYLNKLKKINEKWDKIDFDKVKDNDEKISLFIIKERYKGALEASQFLLKLYEEQCNNIKSIIDYSR